MRYLSVEAGSNLIGDLECSGYPRHALIPRPAPRVVGGRFASPAPSRPANEGRLRGAAGALCRVQPRRDDPCSVPALD